MLAAVTAAWLAASPAAQQVEVSAGWGVLTSRSPLDAGHSAVSQAVFSEARYTHRLSHVPWLWLGGALVVAHADDVGYPAQAFAGGQGSAFEALTTTGAEAVAMARLENHSHFTPDFGLGLGVDAAWHGGATFVDELTLRHSALGTPAEIGLKVSAGVGVSYDASHWSIRLGGVAQRDVATRVGWLFAVPLSVSWRG